MKSCVWLRVLGGVCSTSSASIVFNPSAAVVAYLVSGTQAGWQAISNVKVMAGTVNVMPTQLWTGLTTNRGYSFEPCVLVMRQVWVDSVRWILASSGAGAASTVFASSYNLDATWYCAEKHRLIE